MTSSKRSLTDSFAVQVLVFGTVIVLLTALMATYWPLGADYLYSYRPTAEQWLDGSLSLYTKAEVTYYNAPWGMVLFAPLTLVSHTLGQALLNTGSIMCLLVSIDLFRRVRPVSPVFVLLALANMHVLDILLRGQIDAYIVLGAVLGWWAIHTHRPLVLAAAFVLITLKPQTVLLTGALLLYGMRDWSRRDILIALSLPALALVTSPLIAGLDWPLRLLRFMRDHDVAYHRAVTIWRIADLVGLPNWPFIIGSAVLIGVFARAVLKHGFSEWTFALAITTNLLIGNYVTGYNYPLLIPVLLLVASHNGWLVGLIYLTTFTPALRVFDATTMHWDYLYPVLLYVALWIYAPRKHQRDAAPNEAASAEDDIPAATPA